MSSATEKFLEEVRAVVRQAYIHNETHAVVSLANSLQPHSADIPMVVQSNTAHVGPYTPADRATLHKLKEIIRQKVKFNGQAISNFEKLRKANVFRITLHPSTDRPPSITVDPTFEEVRRYVNGLVQVGSAILIQHCGESVRDLCGLLLRRGAKVELFVQNPRRCVSDRQTNKLHAVHNQLLNHINEDLKRSSGQIDVYRFDEPATVRAVLVEGHILAAGWYTYSTQLVQVPGHRGHRERKEKEVDIKGHIRPMIIVRNGEPSFPVLRDELINPIAEQLRLICGQPWISKKGEKNLQG